MSTSRLVLNLTELCGRYWSWPYAHHTSNYYSRWVIRAGWGRARVKMGTDWDGDRLGWDSRWVRGEGSRRRDCTIGGRLGLLGVGIRASRMLYFLRMKGYS